MLTIFKYMVNVEQPSRTAVLELLKAAQIPVSGTEIGTRLGISRVAARKHILKLVQEGFSIETRKRGYILLSEPEYPTPSEYDCRCVHILDEVESTMEEASHNSEKPQEGVLFYVARRQKSGRGRNRKPWISPEGGLYLTATFKPRLSAAYSSLYVIHSGLCICESLRQLFAADFRFRWPNDICIGEKKLGGLLLEVSGPGESPDRALLGLGLNILSRYEFTRVTDRAVTSLQTEFPEKSKESLSTKYLFNKLKPVIESSLGNIEPGELRKRWKTETAATGSSMVIDAAVYTVCDIALNGSLIAADKEGRRVEVAPGPRIMGFR